MTDRDKEVERIAILLEKIKSEYCLSCEHEDDLCYNCEHSCPMDDEKWIAEHLVDNGIRSKNGFEINMKKGLTKRLLCQHNVDISDGAKFLECWLRKSIIQPIPYDKEDTDEPN